MAEQHRTPENAARPEDVSGSSVPLVELRGIEKHYDDVIANRRTTLSVAEGQIHALLGENGAGKTTLVRILFGLTKPDSGEIYLSGKRVLINSPRDAIRLGIAMTPQHDTLVPGLTIAENFELSQRDGDIVLGLDNTRHVLEDRARRFGLEVRGDWRVDNLSVGQRQWLSLLRALSQPIKLLVLDEATASLTPLERDALFLALRELRDQGVSVILVTHKLDEVFAVSDRTSVLRAGRTVATLRTCETSAAELATLMIGRTIEVAPAERFHGTRGASPLVEVTELCTSETTPPLQRISLDVGSGEILGIAGVDGNGQRELVECLAGLRRPVSGSIRIDGREMIGRPIREFISAGVARIPEDRHLHGLALGMALWENVHLGRTRQRGLVRGGVLRRHRARQLAEALVAEFDVRADNVDQVASELSGGNQQKVILARELADDPRVVVAMNPTRGLDIGAARFVLDRFLGVRRRGGAVILVSFDLDELIEVCDRVIVMSRGSAVGEFAASEVNATTIGLLMGGEVQSPLRS